MSSAPQSRTVVVLGAAGDIGRAVAQQQAQDNVHLVLADLDADGVDRVAESLRPISRVSTHHLDLTHEPEVERLAGALSADVEHGGVTALVNATGIAGPAHAVDGFPVDAFDQVMRVNVRSVFLAHKHLGPLVQPRGSVVNLSSVGGLRGQVNMSAYIASKHAVLGLTRVAALEWASRAVRANAVCPGPVSGTMMDDIYAGLEMDPEEAATAVPLGRIATPRDVADVIGFLISDASRHVTGTYLTVDGGRLAR